MKFIKEQGLHSEDNKIQVTGGGAFKNHEIISSLLEDKSAFGEEFKMELVKNDEMKSLVKGMIFLQDNVNNSWFTFTEAEGKIYHSDESNVFPRILVSMGSGVSIIKINSNDSFERISGTMIGGGTLVGLSNLLLNVKDFSKIQKLSKVGDYSVVDTLVGDIYEGRYENLDKDTVASSFGKVSY